MQLKPVFLVIEDNLIDQLVITQLLKKVLEIEQIIIVNNGKEGIEWLTTKKKNQSLIILLDIQMPIMNGFEFLDASSLFLLPPLGTENIMYLTGLLRRQYVLLNQT